MKCSFYKDTYDRKSRVFVDVESVLYWIKNGQYESQVEAIRNETNEGHRKKLKSVLNAATFSGTFSARRDECLLEYTHLVTIDIDETELSKVYSAIVLFDSHPSCYAYFRSPSGGIKALFLVTSDAKHHSTFAFNQLKKLVDENTKCKVDPSGRNISRLCYMSYDPDLYYNPDAIPFAVSTLKAVDNRRIVTGVACQDSQAIFKIAKKWVNKNDRYYKGNRHNFLLKLSCIMNRAGVPTDKILMLICEHYTIAPSEYKGLEDMMKGINRLYGSEFGTDPIYIKEDEKQKSIF